MVSGAEIRKRVKKSRDEEKVKIANCVGVAMALILAIIPNKSPQVVGLSLVGIAGSLIYAAFHISWIIDAKLVLTRVVRSLIATTIVLIAVAALGRYCWPPHHRHVLSQAERNQFEKPLKDFKQPQMSIHLYCAHEDEVDCEYASDLIPLFGEAGWDVATTVDPIRLGRPKSGILIALHGTVKPEDEPKMKWNEGEWTRVRPEQWAVRQAFANIGIEPDSIGGATVPENQINIYVGHERENESSPTEMTREFAKLGPRDANAPK